jgi:hypothetical protein
MNCMYLDCVILYIQHIINNYICCSSSQENGTFTHILKSELLGCLIMTVVPFKPLSFMACSLNAHCVISFSVHPKNRERPGHTVSENLLSNGGYRILVSKWSQKHVLQKAQLWCHNRLIYIPNRLKMYFSFKQTKNVQLIYR